MGNNYNTKKGGVITLAQDCIEDVVRGYMELVDAGSTNKKKKEYIEIKAQLNSCTKSGLAHLMEENGCMGYIDKLYGSGITKETPRAHKSKKESENELVRADCTPYKAMNESDNAVYAEIGEQEAEAIPNESIIIADALEAMCKSYAEQIGAMVYQVSALQRQIDEMNEKLMRTEAISNKYRHEARN